MNFRYSKTLHQGGRPHEGMTLIEMIGVLAVLAILAGIGLPVAIRHLDQIASDKETANLKALGDALQTSIMRNRYIPTYTDWASVIAAQSGMGVAEVTSNFRNIQRVFWIDPTWVSANPPYTQTTDGTNLPVNARVMLVSSLAKSLPISSGIPSASDFANLWNAPDRTVPSSGSWAGWAGRADDVKVHRVNLRPLFVNLTLSTYTGNTNGFYRVDAGTMTNAPWSNGVSSYYLKSSLITFYADSGSNTFITNHMQLLNEDSSFVFENGTWQNNIMGAANVGSQDIGSIVEDFLAARPNPYAVNTNGNAQQVTIVTNMIHFMSNYIQWASSGFGNTPLYTLLSANKTGLQSLMMTNVQGLYYGGNAPREGVCP